MTQSMVWPNYEPEQQFVLSGSQWQMYHTRGQCGEKSPSLSVPAALESLPKEEQALGWGPHFLCHAGLAAKKFDGILKPFLLSLSPLFFPLKGNFQFLHIQSGTDLANIFLHSKSFPATFVQQHGQHTASFSSPSPRLRREVNFSWFWLWPVLFWVSIPSTQQQLFQTGMLKFLKLQINYYIIQRSFWAMCTLPHQVPLFIALITLLQPCFSKAKNPFCSSHLEGKKSSRQIL